MFCGFEEWLRSKPWQEAPPTPEAPGLLQRSEWLLSLGLLGLLIVFLVPLPPRLLDLLLAFNISITILLMLVTLSVKRALDFSVFPSLLLLTTLFRLALNVATTRLVLLNGNAGYIVSAFGNFVVGGNLVVGLVIFLILIVIQFVVITRGAGAFRKWRRDSCWTPCPASRWRSTPR